MTTFVASARASPRGATPEHRAGGFPFRDIGIHALYLAEAFVGAVEGLEAWPIASGRGDCNLLMDEWRVLARCARGTAQIQMSWNVRPQQNLIVVQGTRGTLRCDLFGLSVTVRRQRPIPEHGLRVVNAVGEGLGGAAQATANLARFATGRLRQFHGLQDLVAEFYSKLAEDQPAPVIPEDARNVVFWTETVARQADRARDQIVADLTARRSAARILVTGATGFIGRSLVQRLLDTGVAVRLLVRRIPPLAWRQDPRIEVVFGDLGDAAAVDQAVAGVSTVYHLGAAMSGGADEFERATIQGTGRLVEGCLKHGVDRLVYMSSLAVIDTDAGRDGRAIDEDSPIEQKPDARGHYTRAKTAAERLVRDAARMRGLRVVILRPGEVVGSGKTLLTPGVAQKAGRTLVVIGNGRLRLPLVHVSDVVDATIYAASAPVESGSIFHLVEDCGLDQLDIIAHYRSQGASYRVVHVPIAVLLMVAGIAETLFGWLGRTAPLGRRRIRAATTPRTFDSGRAERLLGWRPKAGVRSAFSPETPGSSQTTGATADAPVDARAAS